MKKTLCIVLFITLLLSGYIKVTEKFSYLDIYGIQFKDADLGVIPINGDELKPFEGEWVTTKLSVTPRVALVEESYAKENSSIIGKKLVISDECVTFEGEKYYVWEIEKCDYLQLVDLYNITGSNAKLICCGEWVGTHMTDGYPVKRLRLQDYDEEIGIAIIIRPDNTIMLWVGEQHYYIGFYELERIS